MLNLRQRQARKNIVAAALMTFAVLAAGNAQAAISYSTDFESSTAITDDGWYAYINYFTPDCSTFDSQGYGFPAPDNGPQVSALAPGASSQVMNAYSNYDDVLMATHCLETNIYLQYTITADDVGSYVYSYDVELPAAEFTGDKVNGFVKVFTGDFSATLLAEVQPSTAGSKQISVEITDAMVGGILQFGFNNYAYDYEDSGMFYDNVSFAIEQEPPVVVPPPGGGEGTVEGVPTLGTYGLLALLLLMGGTAAIVLVRRS
jgi:hypothetical protein